MTAFTPKSLAPSLKGHRYGITFAVAFLVMAVVVIFFLRGQREIREADRWRNHSIEVLLELEGLAVNVAEMQSAARGFALTGEPRFRTLFSAVSDVALSRAHRVRELTKDNSSQTQRTAELLPLLESLMRASALVVEERVQGGVESAAGILSVSHRDEINGRIATLLRDMVTDERRLLTDRDARLTEGLGVVRWIFIAGVVLAGLIIAWTGWLMRGTIETLRETMAKNQENEWLQTHLARFGALVQGHGNVDRLAEKILKELAELLDFKRAIFYLKREDAEELSPLASYAVDLADKRAWRMGEGLVGQCAGDQRRIVLRPSKGEYPSIATGLSEQLPSAVVLLPIVFENQIHGVLELAWTKEPRSLDFVLLDTFVETLGVAVHALQEQAKKEVLLARSEALANQLHAQQVELQQANHELHSQADELRQSQEMLREQQTELETINVELEEKANQLETERTAVFEKNRELEKAKGQLSDRADQLALSSRYKSEFLANMSHELRTPLNSLMLLSRLLAENREGNLNEKQVQYLRTIENSGNDLLTLINDILDLARIEAGRLTFNPEVVTLAALRTSILQTFQPVAEQKKIAFNVEVENGLPETITTDSQRMLQIMRNLLSNAIKFTARGSVAVRVYKALPDVEGRERLGWEVRDTGIGIAPDKQRLIWEAFQQADGTTNRKFGGTGLGLTISRELATRLGGEIGLQSEEGIGSAFTLYLPIQYAGPASGEDGALRETQAAPRKETVAPFPLGTLAQGRILIVEDDEIERDEVRRLLVERGATVTTVSTGLDAIGTLRGDRYDCVILDLKLPDMGGLDLLDRMRGDLALRDTPVIINTGRLLSATEEARLQRFVHAVVVKGPRSIARLVDEALLFVTGKRPAPKPDSRPPIPLPAEKFSALKDRHVLIVDDDLRNIFATTSVLESHGSRVSFAENGKDAIALLAQTPDVDLVLMDIMMPEMDGYATMRAIRDRPEWRELPIIALTAKAMATDREKCIEAGASDYLSKPVEMERLLSLVQVWLSQRPSKA